MLGTRPLKYQKWDLKEKILTEIGRYWHQNFRISIIVSSHQ